MTSLLKQSNNSPNANIIRMKHPDIFSNFISFFKRAWILWRENGTRFSWYLAKRKISGKQFTPDCEKIIESNYGKWLKKYCRLSAADQLAIRSHLATFPHQPLISIIISPAEEYEFLIEKTINSLQKQLYHNWEAYLVINKNSENPTGLTEKIAKIIQQESRIQVVVKYSTENSAQTLNKILNFTRGEWFICISQADELSSHALYLLINEINNHADAKLIYYDEDSIDIKGKRQKPYFKPSWDQSLFYSANYLRYATLLPRKLAQEIGGFSEEFGPAQHFDLLLKIIEKIQPQQIRHIPFVLYHKRLNTKKNKKTNSLNKYFQAALQTHLNRLQICAQVELAPANCLRVIYKLPNPAPGVSIIILTRDKANLLKTCVNGLFNKTTYPNFEIIIVDNGSVEHETLAYFSEITPHPQVKIIRRDEPFNFSHLNNIAINLARNELICLMNNDIEPINFDWLQEMIAQAIQPNVGIVGAKLYFPDDTIQHAGVVLGIGGAAHHLMRGYPKQYAGYFGNLFSHKNYSAVTAACLLVHKSVHNEIGGFDEQLAVAFNDVDYCIRILRAGYKIIWTPFAELYHYESATRGSDLTKANIARFSKEISYLQNKHTDLLKNDAFYNPNFSLVYPLSLASLPRTNKPWLAKS